MNPSFLCLHGTPFTRLICLALEQMKYMRLNTGALMPMVGLGTYKLPSGELLRQALECGYRHIDTSPTYNTEETIGEVITSHINQGLLQRKDLFITTKIPNNKMSPEDVPKSLVRSLSKLQTDYVDMLLIHMPFGFKGTNEDDLCHYNILETWKAMEKLQKNQLTKSIGVSNFTISQLQMLIDRSDTTPANVQLECHVYYQVPHLQKFCSENEIVMSAYSPLGAMNRPKRYFSQDDPILLEDDVIKRIANVHDKSPAQILLRFLHQQGLIVIPMSDKNIHLEENIAISEFELTDKDIEDIIALDRNFK
ncbi:unnamed protein product, partial [Owenia fusiformis]